ncbi:hypothetical protein [Endozoicomonas euniceicola]|uniref:Uncharacterized protein n=1 Tax=Endozoicomonas euniceicola TaxID=1234143 RepID=A0ABY6GNC6_9GAMM|nr:hypothetical protein [Endozoicomonas euniceicola]UYM14234.1 hypothetical protein NX720_15145 [Endozoicomonas euniceicola]
MAEDTRQKLNQIHGNISASNARQQPLKQASTFYSADPPMWPFPRN